MKINNIIVTLILIIASCFCLSFGAGAETEQIVFSYEKQYDSYSSEISSTVNVDELKTFLRQELVKCPDYIDIYAFSVPASDSGALADMIWDDMTDMFHVNGIGYLTFNGKISELYFSYYYNADTFTSMYSDFITEADKLLDGIKGNSSLSEVEKALLLHDRLALHCEYDIKNLNAGTVPSESFLSYGALVSCKAVCQGYSEAYAYLLEQVGIESRVCESEALNHAWNIVTIDGKEYHVDVTWDDPACDITGQVLHTNFLRSSDGLYSTEHCASDYDTTPSDTRYDNYFWQDSDAAFQLLGDEIYYICSTDNSICRMSDNESLFTIDSRWQAGEYSFWSGSFSRLSADGMTLLYNTADAVYSFNPLTDENKIIWEPDLSAGKYYSIYGFDYSNGYLLCDVVNTPNYTLTTKDTCVQKMKYDPFAPTVTVSVTNDIAVEQTVTLNISDNDVIAGYYWGTDPSCENNKFTATSSDKINISIFSEGTYYYAVKDISGNVSDVGSLVFFKTELNAASGSVIPNYIVTLKGNTVSLPVPVRDNYDFLGWTDSLSSATYITDVCVNKNSTYYAAWQEIVTVTSMSIYSEPLKKEYYIGDPINTDGLILNVSYSNGTSAQINNGFTVSGFDSAVNGVCEVTVGYMDFFDTFSVTVIAPSVSFVLTDINVELKQTADISAVYTPSEVTVTWSSSAASVASVYGGVVTGNSKGVAVITAAIEYNGVIYSADCNVTVSCSHKDVTMYEAIASTCVVQGTKAYTVCNICGDVIDGENESLPLAEHNYIANVGLNYLLSEADCMQSAIYYKSCSVCGIAGDETFTYGSADADNHTSKVLKDQKNSTCIEVGYTGDLCCEKCGAVLETGTAIDITAHVNETVYGYAATCTDTGLTDGEKCSVCNEILVAQTEISALGHNYVETVTAPTCLDSGFTKYTCLVCGDVQTSDYTDAIGHSFGEWADSDSGTQIRICSECGKTEYQLAEDTDDKTDTDIPEEDVKDDTSDTEPPKQDETDDKTDTELPEDDVKDDTSDTEPPKQDETDDKTDTELPEEDVKDDTSDTEPPKQDETDDKTDTDIPEDDVKDDTSDTEPPKQDETDDKTDTELPEEDVKDDTSDTEPPKQDETEDKTDTDIPEEDVKDDTSDTEPPKQDETDDKTDTELPDEDVKDDTSDTEPPKQDETEDKTDTELPEEDVKDDASDSDIFEDNTDDKNESETDISEDNILVLNDGSSLVVNEEKKYVIASENTDILSQIKNSNVVICDLNGNTISVGSVVGTGYVITVNNIVQYNIVINCDVDGNGKVTAADARLALRASANLDKIEGVYVQAADYDGNGNITAADARMILRKSAGLE